MEEQQKTNRQKIPTAEEVKKSFEKASDFKRQIGLYDTVKVNEDFFIGKQWEGVESNGLPTPVYNFLKQVVNFTVSTITSDNLRLKATPMPGIGTMPKAKMEKITKIINRYYDYIIERNRITAKLREFLRNAAVDGDGCMYFYFDPTLPNGQLVSGDIVAEIVQNTRVHFGNPNCRDVQDQPWIIVSQRKLVEDVRWLARNYKENGATEIADADAIKADDEIYDNKYDRYTDDKVTVLKYFFRNRDTDTIWCMDVVDAGVLRKAYDTKCKMYPFVWLSWDFVQDCYHGQALITGLIPNQKFVNKMFALVGVSQLALAFPKVVFDKTKVKNWDGSVGTALGVNGNVDGVAKVIEGASVSPQIVQFMELSMDKTKSLLGATDVAMGDSRPDNTSAIIALQRAANTPMEMTKQAMYQCVEEMGKIWLDIMSVKYGVRMVESDLLDDGMQSAPLGMDLGGLEFVRPFDFAQLKDILVSVQQDAGASSYWSEIANAQTLDNLLMNGHINLGQYLKRMPNGYISERQELIDEFYGNQAAAAPPEMPNGTGMSVETTSSDIPVEGGPGNASLQRALNREGA